MPVSYDDKGKVIRPSINYEWTDEMVTEYFKSSKSVKYFLLNHCKVPTLTKGIINLELRNYQMGMLDVIEKNQKAIVCVGRQCGKCGLHSTRIKIRNKKTGKIEEISMGEFFENL